MTSTHRALTPAFKVDPAVLRQQAQKIVDLLTQHFETLDQKPVKPAIEAGDLASRFADRAPQQATDLDQLLVELEEKIIPGITHWQHPRFFAYYPAASSIPAILGEMVIAAIGSVGLQWSANPISTELECVVMDWIMEMLHAPLDSPFLHRSGQGGGIIQNTAGEALVVIMTAARVHKHLQRAGQDRTKLSNEQREQLYYEDSSSLVVYLSDQTHFSGPKAVRVAGMRVHTIPAQRLENGNLGITASQVAKAMAADRARGLIPCLVQLNFGTTNTCGYDDIVSFSDFAEKESVWVHVDAAYAGPALCLPRFKQQSLHLQDVATSFNFNGSKWFLCGFDSAFLFIRDRRLLTDVFSATDNFMADTHDHDVYGPEFKDWAVPLGRRFRSLRIWMVLSYFGVDGVHRFLEEGIRQADWLREKVDASGAFEQIVQTELGLVCFALKDNAKMETFVIRLKELGADGEDCLLYPSEVHGRRFFRVALGGLNTTRADVTRLWELLERALPR